MKLEELKAFLVLGQRLNYSVAAEELYITQSTLSRIVIRMEEELGQKLLVRDTHSVTLTDAGKLLLKTALEITKKYEQFLRQADRLKNGEYGVFHFAEIYYGMDRYLTKAIGSFRSTYPNASIDIQPMEPADVVESVLKRESDLGFTVYCGEPAHTDVLEYIPIAKEPLVVIFPDEHPLRIHKTISPADLSGCSFLFPSGETSFQNHILSHLREHGVTPGNVVFCDRVNYYTAEILASNAITLVPDCMRDQPHSNLTIRPYSERVDANYAYIRRKDNTNSAVHLYLNHIKK